MKKTIYFLIITFGLIGCSNDSDEQPQYRSTFESLLGKWTFDNNSYYEFSKEKAYLYYDGFSSRSTNASNIEFGTFEFDAKTNIVQCKSNSGETYTLKIDFKDDETATFVKTTTTGTQTLGATKEDEIGEPTESYRPIGVFLTKGEWKIGEEMTMSIYPLNATWIPEHYKYIDKVEYFIDGISVGQASLSPFAYKHVLPSTLEIGKHKLSLKLTLNDNSIIWETLESTFSIVDSKL